MSKSTSIVTNGTYVVVKGCGEFKVLELSVEFWKSKDQRWLLLHIHYKMGWSEVKGFAFFPCNLQDLITYQHLHGEGKRRDKAWQMLGMCLTKQQIPQGSSACLVIVWQKTI